METAGVASRQPHERIESVVLESWVSSLVLPMLGAFVAAPDRSQRGHGVPQPRSISESS